jgi:hypothetical protein
MIELEQGVLRIPTKDVIYPIASQLNTKKTSLKTGQSRSKLFVSFLVLRSSLYNIISQNLYSQFCYYNLTGLDDHTTAAEDAVVIFDTFPTNAPKTLFVVEHPLT